MDCESTTGKRLNLKMQELKHPIPIRKGTALLFSEYPIIIDPIAASIFGLYEAILLQQVHYWLTKNHTSSRNIKEGRVWVYNSYSDWQQQIPFLSKEQIKRAFLNLEQKKVVISHKFEKKDWQQRKWYTIDYDKLETSQVPDSHDSANLHDQSFEKTPLNIPATTNDDAEKNDQNITETTSETSPFTTTTPLEPGAVDIINRLLSKLPREMQLDKQLQALIGQNLLTKSEEYISSNIEATLAQAKSSKKGFLIKALTMDYGHLYRAKKQAADEKSAKLAAERKARDDMIMESKAAGSSEAAEAFFRWAREKNWG